MSNTGNFQAVAKHVEGPGTNGVWGMLTNEGGKDSATGFELVVEHNPYVTAEAPHGYVRFTVSKEDQSVSSDVISLVRPLTPAAQLSRADGQVVFPLVSIKIRELGNQLTANTADAPTQEP
jgi:hypothetical protein